MEIREGRPPFVGTRASFESRTATLAEYTAGLDHAVTLGWLHVHESGPFVKLT